MSNFLKTQNNKGFALLFSIIVVSVVVITTLAVSSIVRRGLEITSVGERSMEAFFAADAGLECALYWDIRERNLVTGISSLRPGGSGNISCLDSSITVTSIGQVARFGVRNRARDLCADVMVTVTGLDTEVQSRGYNTCDENDPKRIERGLEARY